MYTVDYFIKKFEAIPENLWHMGSFGEKDIHCAAGHCGSRLDWIPTEESKGLANLLNKLPITCPGPLFEKDTQPGDLLIWNVVANINDCFADEYQQPTPKQRILAALYDIKKMQQPVYEDISKDLAVLPVNETSDLVKQNQLA